MNKAILYLLILISLGTNCSSSRKNLSIEEAKPEIEFEFWAKKSKVSEAINFEKSLDNEYEILIKNVLLSESVFPLLYNYSIANPFIIKRKQTGFLPIYAEYFFSEQDSLIRYISYDFERDRYGNYNKKQEIWKEESTKLNEYNQEYEKLKLTLIKEFGQPIQQDSIPQLTKSNSGGSEYSSRDTVWETEAFYAKLNMIFASSTYRIRLNYYWKK